MRMPIFRLMLMLVCADANAHEDTVFFIRPDGRIDGAPASYGPIQILADFSTSEMSGTPPPVMFVMVGRTITPVPACIMEVARGTPREALSAHGSWYHERGTLPPYLVIALSSSKQLMFNLEDGALLLEPMRRYGGIDDGILCSCEESEEVLRQLLEPISTQSPASTAAERKESEEPFRPCNVYGPDGHGTGVNQGLHEDRSTAVRRARHAGCRRR